MFLVYVVRPELRSTFCFRGETQTAMKASRSLCVAGLDAKLLSAWPNQWWAGIYTADPESLSLRATMPRFLEMEDRHRSVIRGLRKKANESRRGSASDEEGAVSGARYSLFLSFDRGMQVLSDELAQRIAGFKSQDTSAAIKLNTRIDSLTLERETDKGDVAARWKIRTSDNETFTADAVCMALPGYVSARLLSDVDPQLSSELDKIPYASSTTVNLAYRRSDIPNPLEGFGFVVPFVERRTIMACTFSSVKFAGRAPKDHALLRVFTGGGLQPELFALPEAELITRIHNDLRDLLGVAQPPLFTQVSRWDRSMPQYLLGHIERVKQIEARAASLPGFALAGNAYTGIGIPDCIRSGEAAAAKLTQTFSE